MKVVFRTNIDHYKKDCWPKNIETPPRIGESVMVVDSMKSYYSNQKLPIKLEVVDVIYSENQIDCELWYNKLDVKSARLSGVKLF